MTSSQVEVTHPSGAYARVIADSVSPSGQRVTSIQARFWRPILAEVNTHAVWSRNSASSRAIPARKQVQRVREDPSLPVSWPAEQKGMQGGAELEGEQLHAAQAHWGLAQKTMAQIADHLIEIGLHKSVTNRLLEPFQWHTALITATAWDNAFRQRVSPLAQPEFRVVATCMKEAIDQSTPVLLDRGQWHMPYLDSETIADVLDHSPDGMEMLKQISVARCARTSMETQEGVRDWAQDLNLYKRLETADPMHASPFEHVCTPAKWNSHSVDVPDPDTSEVIYSITLPKLGKFLGWQQFRHVIEAQQKVQSFS